jgi:hypothetical protein
MQSDAASRPEIGGILESGFVLTVIPIYVAARLMRNPLGHASLSLSLVV